MESDKVATWSLTVAELASVLARRAREGGLTVEQRDAIFQAFVAHTRDYVMLDLGRLVVQQAATMLLASSESVRLRSLAALHLSGARLLLGRARRRGVATGAFVCSDRAPLRAAAWSGFHVLNPEHYA